ncbi:MAG: DUF1559 domain-containing protein [Thermoguttaceae bacterium]
MKNTFSRRAFTLVELLVVIAIIGVLMGLTIPAVQSARAAARMTTCLNNEKQIATAAIAHDSTLGYLPFYRYYYRNGGAAVSVSWVIPLLPQLGETALWNSWENGNAQYSSLAFLICPDNKEKKTVQAGLSYGANCGYSGTENDGGGVYAFQLGAFVKDPQNNKRSMISKMKDGASYTILASENFTIQNWQPAERTANGILWASSLTTNNFPSSKHPQLGFNTVFADGSGKYLNRNIGYVTYCQLMAPDDKKASKYNSNMNNPMDTKQLGN